MNIFQIGTEGELAIINFLLDGFQAGLDLLKFFGGQQPRFFQGRSVGNRSLDVELVQSPIERDRFSKPLNGRRSFLLKASFPHGG